MVTWLNEVALQICSIRSEKRQTDDPETAIPCVLKICNLQRMHIFASFISETGLRDYEKAEARKWTTSVVNCSKMLMVPLVSTKYV